MSSALGRTYHLSIALVRVLLIVLWGTSASSAASYTWVGTGGNTNWSNANNWDPVREPAPDDILLFDGSRTPSVSVTVDFASPQNIGQLRFINGIVALMTVQPSIDGATLIRQLNINADLAGADFEITGGCSVQIRNPDGVKSTGLIFQLGTVGTAVIAGTLIFGSTSTVMNTNDPHQLISLNKGFSTIQFTAGSVFKAERTFIGFSFNDKSDSGGTVVFNNGSTYDHRGGSTPFGTSLPTAPVTIFKKDSYYIFSASFVSTGPQLSGRTYGFLEYNRSGTTSGTFGTRPLTILNDLTITTGDVRLNAAAISIQGDIHITSGTLINPGNGSSITLNGSAAQRITSTTATPVSLGKDVTLTVNNLAGVTLQTPIQIAGTLTLTKGKLSTSKAAPLTLAAGATISANENSYIVGPLTRVVAANGTTSLDFPIGSATAYRPLTLTVNHADATEARYTAEQVKRKPTARTFSGSIKKVSTVRYFTISASAANFINGSIGLSYGFDDGVDNAEKLRIAQSSADNQTWEDLGGAGSGFPTGAITSSTPFTSFGTFVLASTAVESTSGNNPLPVELISLSAHYRASGVLIQWATANEKDNAGFEVERSIDGRTFAVVTKVKGQGQSNQKQTYSAWDTAPTHEPTVYYRLRQLDFDGSATYSGVVAVKGAIQNALYPNPARAQLTFHAEALGNYRIVAATGQVIRQGQTLTRGLVTLNVAALPAGLYYLETSSDNGHTKHRFMKQAE